MAIRFVPCIMFESLRGGSVVGYLVGYYVRVALLFYRSLQIVVALLYM